MTFAKENRSLEQRDDQVVEVMPGIVEKLRAISPFNSDQADWLQERDLATAASD